MNISSTIKAIQDIMRKDDGVDSDAQRIGQLTWMLFLKVFDQREEEWEDDNPKYKSPIPEKIPLAQLGEISGRCRRQEKAPNPRQRADPVHQQRTFSGIERNRCVGQPYQKGYQTSLRGLQQLYEKRLADAGRDRKARRSYQLP
jgi:type I restriction-modification system DNA methylase subunit